MRRGRRRGGRGRPVARWRQRVAREASATTDNFAAASAVPALPSRRLHGEQEVHWRASRSPGSGTLPSGSTPRAANVSTSIRGSPTRSARRGAGARTRRPDRADPRSRRPRRRDRRACEALRLAGGRDGRAPRLAHGARAPCGDGTRGEQGRDGGRGRRQDHVHGRQAFLGWSERGVPGRARRARHRRRG